MAELEITVTWAQLESLKKQIIIVQESKISHGFNSGQAINAENEVSWNESGVVFKLTDE